MLLDILNPKLSLKANEVFVIDQAVLDPDTHEVMYQVGEVLTMRHIFVMLESGIDMVGLTKTTKG
jgi:flagellar biosynthesis regulator FlbT